MDLSQLLNGFVKVSTSICQKCSVYFSPFAKQNEAEVWPIFQIFLKLLLWTKVVEWVKVFNALGPLCLRQCIKTNPETKFFWDCYWNTLWDKICFLYLFGKGYQHSQNFKSNRLHSHFLSWNMWNTKTFLRPLQRFFWDQIFRDQYWDCFETDTETFFKINLLRPLLQEHQRDLKR